jgi:hypothetical protein
MTPEEWGPTARLSLRKLLSISIAALKIQANLMGTKTGLPKQRILLQRNHAACRI